MRTALPNWRWLREHATSDPDQAAQLTLATWLRETSHQPEPPVDVMAIAAWLGVDVRFVGLGEAATMKQSATLDPRRDPPVVRLRKKHPNHWRFSLAHELGHLMLHDLDVEHDRDMTVRNRTEREANQFAAALLMPQRWVDHDVYFDTTDVGFLARRYQVSRDAMGWRLKNLRLVP
jgi:hypothetical protein